jgi:subtilisin family serine protease
MTRLGLPHQTVSDNPIPQLVIGYVSVQGSESVFGKKGKRLRKSPKAYYAKKSDRDSVRRDLEKNGFSIIAETALGMSVVAPGRAYEDITGGELQAIERLMYSEAGRTEYVTHLDIVGNKQPTALGVGAAKSKTLKIDGIVLERPRIYHAIFPSPIPPNSPKLHLRVPGDVEVALNAVAAHQQGQRGGGVLVAMPDSGWFRHPFFTAHGYNIKTPIAIVPGTDRSKDPQGHGTGESANIFAVAPEAVLQPLRASNDDGDLVGAIAGFLKAKDIRPKIITCSWGGDELFPPSSDPPESELPFVAEIQDAIAQGILVVFSAGNGQFSVEPQAPGVLAAGGVFMDSNGDLRASDYASGYQSTWFDKHVVPTVCGLVGMQPRAQYLMLPIPPGCSIDQGESKPDETDPTTDGTPGDDGWALFSGTSAAAPQLAGAAALLLGAKPNLTPTQVIESLTNTATDVVVGHSFPQRFNSPAGPGPDLATGAGIINVGAALQFALDRF